MSCMCGDSECPSCGPAQGTRSYTQRKPREPAIVRQFRAFVAQTFAFWRREVASDYLFRHPENITREHARVFSVLHGGRMMLFHLAPPRKGSYNWGTVALLDALLEEANAKINQDEAVFNEWVKTTEEMKNVPH